VCGAGAKLKNIAMEARRTCLGGFEFLEGIPGSLGGALRMNAGAMGSSLFNLVEKLRFMDGSGQVLERPASEIPVQYRSCQLLKSNIALGAVLRGAADSMEAICGRMKSFSEKRWEMQPKEPSAGCTFKNPEKMAAGKLIDQLGLKGARVGGASVSQLHANFIINDGTASARDVLELIALIIDRVKRAEGIELQTEVEIVGED
jgi:UDP-N-acetylenolpyruvoylglucosamine reductase